MRVSVVLCVYSTERYDDFLEAAESVLGQTYDDTELVVVVDGSESVHRRVVDAYGADDRVRIHCNDRNRGLLESRNRGAEIADGDVVAFIDDDAVADERWIEKLVAAYDGQGAAAVGGRMVPEWVAGKPAFLPEEFYWLVGVTHRGFADEAGYVRNTNGSNISFRRGLFLELGGFDADIGGRKGDQNLQGGETELCARMADEHGERVWYTPDAEVAHKVFDYRTDPRWLLNRAFWQGYSKRAMETLTSADASAEESEFLGRLLGEFVPSRVRALVKRPDAGEAAQLVTLVALTGTVGAGYLYGLLRW